MESKEQRAKSEGVLAHVEEEKRVVLQVAFCVVIPWDEVHPHFHSLLFALYSLLFLLFPVGHHSFTGHLSHFGLLAVQISRPWKIM